jgi:hypothetical protein
MIEMTNAIVAGVKRPSHCSAMRSLGSADAILATSPMKCRVSAGSSAGRSPGTMLL